MFVQSEVLNIFVKSKSLFTLKRVDSTAVIVLRYLLVFKDATIF